MMKDNISTDVARGRTGRVLARVCAVIVIATGLGGGSLIGVGPAAASVPGLVAEDETLVSSSAQSQSVTAQCPSGTVLVNAGGYITGGGGSVAMARIVPDPATQSVTVTGKEIDPYSGLWRPTAVPSCAPTTSVPGLQWVDEPSVTDSNDKSVAAECPPGQNLVGTGYDTDNGFGEVLVTIVHPENGGPADPADGVEVAAYEEAPYPDPWTVTAWAACADPLPGQQVLSNNGGHDATNPKSEFTQCDPGQVATGGGVAIIVDPAGIGDVVVDDIYPNNVGAGVAPTAMTAYAYTEGGFGGFFTLVDYALCADA